MKKIKVNFNDDLNKDDSPTQTYGCRANNPEICANMDIEGVCAFVRSDGICKRPSRAWKKQYEKLKNK